MKKLDVKAVQKASSEYFESQEKVESQSSYLKSQKPNNSNNIYSSALFIVGWAIMVLGILGACVIASDSYAPFTILLAGGILSVASGLLLIGVSQMINLLCDNKKVMENIQQELNELANH